MLTAVRALAVLLTCLLPLYATAQAHPASHPAPAAAEDRALQARLDAQTAATASGDPAVAERASEAVLALALREMGDARSTESEWDDAAKLLRASLSLEAATGTQLDLAEALLRGTPPQPDAAKTLIDAALLSEPKNSRALALQRQAVLGTEASRSLPLTPAARRALTAREGRLREVLANAYDDLGTAQAREGRFPEAVSLFHQAEHWDPATPGLMRNLGLAAFRMGDFPESARALELALAADPNDTQARLLLGLSLFSSQRFAEAAKAFAPLGDAVLSDAHAAYAWAFSLVRAGDSQRALPILRHLQAESLPAEELGLVCQVYAQAEDYEGGVGCFRKLAAEAPTLKGVHYQTGIALIHLDRPADAAGELQKELALDPGNPNAEFYLAYALLQTSHKDEAATLLAKVVAEQPDNAQAQYQLGKLQLADGDTTDAVGHLEAAVRSDPTDAFSHYQLQLAYRKLGRTADAERELTLYREIKARHREPTPAPDTP